MTLVRTVPADLEYLVAVAELAISPGGRALRRQPSRR